MCHCNDDNVAIIITTARKYEPIQEEVKEREGKGEGEGEEGGAQRGGAPRGEWGREREGEKRGKEERNWGVRTTITRHVSISCRSI